MELVSFNNIPSFFLPAFFFFASSPTGFALASFCIGREVFRSEGPRTTGRLSFLGKAENDRFPQKMFYIKVFLNLTWEYRPVAPAAVVPVLKKIDIFK